MTKLDRELDSAKTSTPSIPKKADTTEASITPELSDEQISKISGGSGFPTNGGSGDTPINPNPSPPMAS